MNHRIKEHDLADFFHERLSAHIRMLDATRAERRAA